MYAVSGCPQVSGTTFPSTSRRIIMGQVGTGAPSLSGSTLPCVGQWYSIFMPHRSTRSQRGCSVPNMTSVQLRRYEIMPGEMERFLEAVRTAFPVREQYGFGVEFALVDEERNEFTWAVSHDGDFAKAEAAYYASPERASLPANPADFIDVMHLGMVRVERL